MKQHTLQGLRVLNTRPLEQGRLLTQGIQERGGIAIEFPLLTIEPLPVNWLAQAPALETLHCAIFISGNAVEHFFTALKQQSVLWPCHIKTIAIGKASAAVLNRWSIQVSAIPSVADSEHLLELPLLQNIKGQTVLLIKGEGGRVEIKNTLQERGANLIALDVYRRCLPTLARTHFNLLWHDKAVDIILLTSQEAIHNLFTLLGEAAQTVLCKIPCLVISERLAKIAAKFGIQTIILSRYDTLFETLEHYKKGLIHDKQQ